MSDMKEEGDMRENSQGGTNNLDGRQSRETSSRKWYFERKLEG